MQYVQRCSPRPWIPRLYLRMTAGLRVKLSSRGVTIKKKGSKDWENKSARYSAIPVYWSQGKWIIQDLSQEFWIRISMHNIKLGVTAISPNMLKHAIQEWQAEESIYNNIYSYSMADNYKSWIIINDDLWEHSEEFEGITALHHKNRRRLILNLAQYLPFLRSGGPRLKATEEYPASFGRTLAHFAICLGRTGWMGLGVWKLALWTSGVCFFGSSYWDVLL